jgi:hypothetical protein
MKNSMAKQLPAVTMLVTSLCVTFGARLSLAADKTDVIASDPCVLVTLADLRSVLGSYDSEKLLVSVFTGNEELTEFQKDSSDAKKRHDNWGKTIKVSNVSVPYYQSVGEGRLIVWKNRTRFTVGVQDITFSMSDEALEAAREKLINMGLSRMN